MRQEPNLKRSPGNSVKATTIGAACRSCGTSLTGGRARLYLPSSSSGSCTSDRSTENSRSSRSSNSVAAACRGWKRSGLVTREYASSGGPSMPHLSPRMSSPSARISTQLFAAGVVLVALVTPQCSAGLLWGVNHLQQREDGPPVPHRARGLQLRGEVLVRQLAPGHAVGVVQVDVATAYSENVLR